MVSIIIPTYNEEIALAANLDSLRRVRGDFEVIVADGRSTDRTREQVETRQATFPRPMLWLSAERPRALQLNRGAEIARGDSLLFLYADALLASDAIEALCAALEREDIVGGNFNLRYEEESDWARLFTWINRHRRAFGIYYGDSAIFVRRAVFDRLGGFRPIPIMDDYEFVRRLERSGRTVCLHSVVTVSSRRWRRQGVLRTLWSWFVIQSLYSMGVEPRRLDRWYRPVRENR
ncbi:MAG TPA: TIGR04283 family arsenosugar biosynthesis glycosyltransferase [Terriglobia bacterium]|nr:TIGR04283 family arsenosugar biosynthesis glycosyltransferase [Terriglobia bacterium]